MVRGLGYESSLMADLLDKIESVAREQHATRVVGVTVAVGALANISPHHFREHFVWATRGTMADGARLEIQIVSDAADPGAQDIHLESVEVEE